MGADQAERVKEPDGVLDQIAARILGGARLVADRAAGVAIVVAGHEPGAGRELRAELLLPREHRAAGSRDEQDRRVRRVTEGLEAQINAVCADDPLARHDLMIAETPKLIAAGYK
jgi:hypothetical protein